MVVRVDDRNHAPTVDGQCIGVVKLPGFAPGTPPKPQRLAVERKLLHPMVAVLTNVKTMVRADRQVVRITELTRVITSRAPGFE